MQRTLLDNFKENTDHELLKVLIEEYNNSSKLSEDDLLNLLVSKLKEVFEENYNAIT